MKRLFTFGCSFTRYSWPTWADFLGLEFDYHENWGLPGIGNVAIANRIAECYSKGKLNKNDTVIVQWSSHIRNDYHTFRSSPRGRNAVGWKTKGSIFNYLNQNVYDKDWIVKFFDERSYIMYSLNSMVQAKAILDNSNCTWKMTSISDFSKLGSDITIEPEGYAENIGDEKNLWTGQGLDGVHRVDFSHYRDSIGFDKWLEPIGTYSWKNEDKQYVWKDAKDTEAWTDPHPSVDMHVSWLDNVLKPSLTEHRSIDTDNKKVWIETAKKLKSNILELDRFEEELIAQLLNWNRFYIGY